MLTAKELADRLNGRQYLSEITRQEATEAKKSGLVVIHGGSDDLIYFDGAIYDELGAWDGIEFLIDSKGVLPPWESAKENEKSAADFIARKPNAVKLTAYWCEPGQDFDWTYKTDIPHYKFEILDGPDMYCMGIVFSMNDLAIARG